MADNMESWIDLRARLAVLSRASKTTQRTLIDHWIAECDRRIIDTADPAATWRSLELLGPLVRARRAEAGLSLRALADESGANFNAIGRLERGAAPSWATAIRLLDWLSIPAPLSSCDHR
jgi:DNA-binding XRE family transcriptional regulator